MEGKFYRRTRQAIRLCSGEETLISDKDTMSGPVLVPEEQEDLPLEPEDEQVPDNAPAEQHPQQAAETYTQSGQLVKKPARFADCCKIFEHSLRPICL